ncbi:hypothetical protein ABH978_000950 [Bradyrhizobium ottawaense]|uniref:hypothetical protein n=1 Tax=Bradyrhizobium ottawaense TaxID=931866 RepID=UPI0035137AAC
MLKRTLQAIIKSPLTNALQLVARKFVPVAVLTALILGIANFIHQQSNHQWSRGIETYIVLEQIRRSERLPASDLAFLGDSSCLFGIHVPTLLHAFPGSDVEAFCTIGYVGPDGYAAMLDKMIARGRQPKKLVLVFNPIQFERDPRWNEWPTFIRTDRFEVPSGLTFPAGGLEYIRLLMERAVYTPLPGAYAIYYGGKDQFISTIWSEHGSAIDPNRMLDIPSLEAFRATLPGHVLLKPLPASKPFVMNAEFEKALNSLSVTLSKLDAVKGLSRDLAGQFRQCSGRPAELPHRGRQEDCGSTWPRSVAIPGYPRRHAGHPVCALSGAFASMGADDLHRATCQDPG